MSGSRGEASSNILRRVMRARALQIERQGKPNARLSAADVHEYCATDHGGADLLGNAIRRLGLSARGYHRVLKVARTIADLGAETKLKANHIAEAVQYRRLEKSAALNA